jgi:8-oxo-dGTP pyrophosphatase MutT (NUDIX family)
MFVARDGSALFLKRSANSDSHPNEWAFAGGHIEDGETAEEAAIRECEEETGYTVAAADIRLHTRSLNNAEVGSGPVPAAPLDQEIAELAPDTPPGEAVVVPGEVVDFTTFICRVKETFAPKLNEESAGYAWAPVDMPPEPLHPGCRIALDRLSMNELDVARAMRDGRLTSPQRYMNVTLWAMRITGTGRAYRSELKEHVWRDPSIYMNDEFLARCNGLPVIMEHPEKRAILNSKEFNDRIIGTVFLPYLRPDIEEVWGIVKIWDDASNEMFASRQLSTSPSVILGTAENNLKLKKEDGSTLLIEGDPTLADHLAACALGTWDKDGPPVGIDTPAENDDGVRHDSRPPRHDLRIDVIGHRLQGLNLRLAAARLRMG